MCSGLRKLRKKFTAKLARKQASFALNSICPSSRWSRASARLYFDLNFIIIARNPLANIASVLRPRLAHFLRRDFNLASSALVV
jgi:hypothetical protein